ncbi:MAG: thioredoxin family protein [Actinomycetota bacterium]
MSDPAFRFAVLSVLFLLVAVAGRALSRYFNAAEFPKRFDLGDAGIKAAGPAVVEFTAPWCLECKEALPTLEAASRQHDATLAVIDAKDNPGVAAKYKIRTTPTILVIDRRGIVTSAWNSTPAPGELASALQAAGAPRPQPVG